MCIRDRVSEGKYGFTNENGALGVTLINTSESPDPAPERHVHDIRLWLAVSAGDAKACLLYTSRCV